MYIVLVTMLFLLIALASTAFGVDKTDSTDFSIRYFDCRHGDGVRDPQQGFIYFKSNSWPRTNGSGIRIQGYIHPGAEYVILDEAKIAQLDLDLGPEPTAHHCFEHPANILRLSNWPEELSPTRLECDRLVLTELDPDDLLSIMDQILYRGTAPCNFRVN